MNVFELNKSPKCLLKLNKKEIFWMLNRETHHFSIQWRNLMHEITSATPTNKKVSLHFILKLLRYQDNDKHPWWKKVKCCWKIFYLMRRNQSTVWINSQKIMEDKLVKLDGKHRKMTVGLYPYVKILPSKFYDTCLLQIKN